MKILFLLGASLIYQSNCSAQEFDFSKFKFEGSQVIKSKLITISKTNPLWQQIKLKPIKNVPVKLVDNNNNSVDPNQKMITPTNKVLTAKAYVDSLNYYERELNKEGHSISGGGEVVVSKTINDSRYLSNKVLKMPNSVGSFLTRAERDKFLNPSMFVNDIEFKPLRKYAKPELEKFKSMKFFLNENGILSFRQVTTPIIKTQITSKLLKQIDYTKTVTWPSDGYLGNPETFAAGTNASFEVHVKQYSFENDKLDENPSTYQIKGGASIYGSIFNNKFDIFTVKADAFVPASPIKSSLLKFQVKTIGGVSLLNLNKITSRDLAIYDSIYKKVDYSYGLNIPIVGPISFSGRIGIRGEAGISYGFELDKTFLLADITPAAAINGYAEIGVDAVFVGLGVGGKLNFISAELPLIGYAGLWPGSEEQALLVTGYNLGYRIRILNGQMYAYAELCWPWPRICKKFKHQFFDWDGFTFEGTIDNASNVYVLDK